MNQLAKIISIVFQPLLMPLYGLVLLYGFVDYFRELPMELTRIIFIVVGIGTFLLPLSFFPLYFYFKVINSIEMETRQERIMPLLITLMFYYLTYQSLQKDYVPLIIQSIVFASFIVVLITEGINFVFKISVHMTGAGSLVGLALVFVLNYNVYSIGMVIVPLIIAGIIGYARLKLNAHKPAEVYLGFFSGCSLMYLLLRYVLI